MSMTQRELYGSWVQQIHAALAQKSSAKTQKESAKWAERARTMAECARGLRAVAGLNLPEPHEIYPRRDDESQREYEERIGLRSTSIVADVMGGIVRGTHDQAVCDARSLAARVGCPVLVCHLVYREGVEHDAFRLVLADLRDSQTRILARINLEDERTVIVMPNGSTHATTLRVARRYRESVITDATERMGYALLAQDAPTPPTETESPAAALLGKVARRWLSQNQNARCLFCETTVCGKACLGRQARDIATTPAESPAVLDGPLAAEEEED